MSGSADLDKRACEPVGGRRKNTTAAIVGKQLRRFRFLGYCQIKPGPFFYRTRSPQKLAWFLLYRTHFFSKRTEALQNRTGSLKSRNGGLKNKTNSPEKEAHPVFHPSCSVKKQVHTCFLRVGTCFRRIRTYFFGIGT